LDVREDILQVGGVFSCPGICTKAEIGSIQTITINLKVAGIPCHTYRVG
jgi:hypothetical protein